MSVASPIKWHGGKAPLASRIVALFPSKCRTPNAPAPDDKGYLHYVEPYAGGLSVLLENDPEGISEVVGDKHPGLTTLWLVLQGEFTFELFKRRMDATPFSEVEWLKSLGWHLDSRAVHQAAKFFIRCRQSLSGRMDAFAARSRSRTRQGMNEQVAAWLSCVDGLPAVHARLRRVLILNDDALTVIRKEDGPRTLFYLDPPYLHETRATTKEYGEHEMTAEQHGELLETISQIKGRFLLSGYRSDLYDKWASACGWDRYEFDVPNNAAGGKEKRRMVECVWVNYSSGGRIGHARPPQR